ncbi:hypothetical protein ACFO4L_09730 [Bacillus daqingensis]|uniref:DUF4367 domain-containing protein n=1 Tax=Bacillus daqingensis TaxID=872396 RepID=A0ABV9NU53_9BACI
MKKILLLSTIALLAACQETDTESADAETNVQENEREEENESVEEEPEEADPAEELDGVWFDEEEELYVVVDAMEQTAVLANESDTVETTIKSWDSSTVELEDADPFFEEEEIDWERNEEILTLQQGRTVYLLEKASLSSYLSFLDEAEEENEAEEEIDNEPENNSEQEEVNDEESELEVEEDSEPEINWTTYTNDRFGFSVSYPAEWNPGEAPTNNDGLTLYEQNGNTVTVYASYAAGSFAEGETSSVTIQSGETAEQAVLREGASVTYTAEVVAHDTMYTVYANVSDSFYAEIEQVLEDMTRSMEVWGEETPDTNASEDMDMDMDLDGTDENEATVMEARFVDYSEFAPKDVFNDSVFHNVKIEDYGTVATFEGDYPGEIFPGEPGFIEATFELIDGNVYTTLFYNGHMVTNEEAYHNLMQFFLY